MSSPETPSPDSAAHFVAPDESKRVEDPKKAEAMARASHEVRSEAAQMREDVRNPEPGADDAASLEFAKAHEKNLDEVAEEAEEEVRQTLEKPEKAEPVSILTRQPWLRDMPRESWPADAREEAEREGI